MGLAANADTLDNIFCVVTLHPCQCNTNILSHI